MAVGVLHIMVDFVDQFLHAAEGSSTNGLLRDLRDSTLVSRIPPKEFVNGFLSMGKADPASLRALYGEEVFQSDYFLKQRILEATPEKVGLLTPRREAVGTAMLLVIKGIVMPNGAESGIDRIRAGDFRGFQFGDPRSRPKFIDLEIHNEDGGLGFIFTQRQGMSEPAVAQEQINRVIQSLRKLPNQN